MLSMLLVGGMFLGAVLPPLIVRREIDNQTTLTVISKPLPRPLFIIGKYLGVAAAVLLAEIIWTLMLLMLRRHGVMSTAADRYDWPVIVFAGGAVLVSLVAAGAANYLFRRNFSSAFARVLAVALFVAYLGVMLFAKGFQIQLPLIDLAPQVWAASIAMWMAALILAAVGVAAAIRLTLVPAFVLVVVVAVAGVVSDYFFGDGGGANAVAWRVVPNIGFLNVADAFTQGGFITFGYLGSIAVYSGLMICAALAVAIALFQTRQVG
jgi:hypothetical protein